MSTDPKRREDLLAHCGELHDDDRVDPREYFKPATNHVRQRKTRQLCSQVAQALSLILSSEFDDDLLLGLTVLAVEPAPNESQLLVTLRSDCVEPSEREEILRRLSQATGFLRSEVAAAITRKRAPQLVFRLN
jgi:ribosome-binding factor A